MRLGFRVRRAFVKERQPALVPVAFFVLEWHRKCLKACLGLVLTPDMAFSRIKILCALFFVLGAALSLLITRALDSGSSSWHLQGKTAGPAPSFCGRIEAVQIPLASPDGVFPDRDKRLEAPKWFFENVSESSLTRFLNSCDLRPSEQRMFLDKRSWKIKPEGIEITPSEKLIWSLKPDSREQIYSVLAKSRANFPQCFPFRFPLGGLDRQFKQSELSVADIEKIRRLTYTNSGYLCFTDLEPLKRVLKPTEFNELIETLYQVPTYMLRLNVTPDSDVDALVNYWGKGGREKLIAPLINSLAKVPGGTTLNVSFLLPTFARLRLYTYPYTWKDPSASRQDCFFTSMNFFNGTPNTNFFDREYTTKVLGSEYAKVDRWPSFGDVVALSNGNGEIFHTCVYVAEDFVFTKNGVAPEQPWVLMKLPDMIMVYFPIERISHVSFLRRKVLQATKES